MKTSTLIPALFIYCLIIPQASFGQMEKFDIIQHTPPKGWTKTVKEGAIVYSVMNKRTNAFCIMTLYASAASAGSPQIDFANKWDEFVVKPFKAVGNPKTETQSTPEGWQATVGGAQIELDGGIKAATILTNFSGFGKTASVLVIFNDESYLAEVTTLIDNIKLDKTSRTIQNNPGRKIQKDPFPDKPGYQPQKPLAGALLESITMADLVGTWDQGAASVTTYVDSSSGDYSHTDTTFYSESYTIKPDGTFDHRFQGRTANHTVREADSGTIVLSGGNILVKFDRGTTYRYQFISFMTLPNNGALLSLVHIGENENLYGPDWMTLECGHGSGYIHCAGGEEWTRRTQ